MPTRMMHEFRTEVAPVDKCSEHVCVSGRLGSWGRTTRDNLVTLAADVCSR